jgi:MFS family permease
MLPRLVVAAILVNISYFISQLAIDISNILGFSIKDLFNGLTTKVIDTTNASSLSTDAFATGNGLAGVAGGVLASGLGVAALYALLSTLIPVLLAAVLALVMILFILIARQAIVVLLVVISPLAFVAFLLPNTEGLFKQWRKMLTSMLLLFPIIALVFGGAQLASQVLSGAFDGTVTGDTSNWFGQIAAAAVLVLPLFAVPVILKKSLDGIPVLGQQMSKLASRTNGNLSKRVGESYKNSLIGRGRANKKRSDQAYMDRKFANRMQKGGLASRIANGPGITGKQKYAQQTLNSAALLTVKKAQIEDIEAAGATIEGLGRPALREIARGGGAGAGNPATMAAAIKQTVASNDVEGINQLWNESKSWGDDEEGRMKRSTFTQSLRASANRPNYLGQGAISAMEQNDQSAESAYKAISATIVDAVSAGAYSPDKIASADPDELKVVQSVANTTTDPSFQNAHQQLINDAHTALTDPQLLRTMTKNRGVVGQMRGNERIPPADPSTGPNGSPLR